MSTKPSPRTPYPTAVSDDEWAPAGVDHGDTGEKAAQKAAAHGILLEVVKLPEAKRGFVLLPRRWLSSAASPGRRACAAWPAMLSGCPPSWPACMSSPSPASCCIASLR